MTKHERHMGVAEEYVSVHYNYPDDATTEGFREIRDALQHLLAVARRCGDGDGLYKEALRLWSIKYPDGMMISDGEFAESMSKYLLNTEEK